MISTVKVVRVKLVCDTCRVSSSLRPTPRSLYDACGQEGWSVLSDARAKCLASHCPRCTQARDLTPGHVVHLLPRTSHAKKRASHCDAWAELFRGGMTIAAIARAENVHAYRVRSALAVRGLYTAKTRKVAA